MSEESVTTPTTSSYGLAPRQNYIDNAKTQVKFDGSWLEQDIVSFTHENIVNFFIVYELTYDHIFRAGKLTKNADPDKYSPSTFLISL